MKQELLKIITVSVLVSLGFLNQSCSSSDIGGNEDRISPAVVLSGIVDSNNADGEIIGMATIQWVTTEPNPSTVDIYLSDDSGVTYALLANHVPDTGEYTFDTNTVDDCRQCRLRILARDVVGNVSASSDSAQDFIINNVPQVLGAAVYFDPDDNGPDDGDTLIVPFDKDLELRTGIASDIFLLPVLGDSIGPFATVAKGVRSNELVITMNGLVTFTGHLHIGKEFDPQRLHRTAPSGFNVRDNLSGGVLFAPDTGRTAAAAAGIDIASGFADSGQAIGSSTTMDVAVGDVDADGDVDMVEATTSAINIWLNNGSGYFGVGGTGVTPNQTWAITSASSVVLADINGDGDLDLILGRNSNNPNRVYQNSAGVFSDSGQSLGNSYTTSLAVGDVDDDGDLDFAEGNFGMANRIWRNNGSGVFSDSGQAMGSLYTNAIVLGDVDGDDDLDVIEGNQNQSKHVWLNNGVGVFTDSGQIFANSNTNALVLGDVDNDGDLDLVEGKFSNQGNQLWLNDGAGTYSDSGQALGNYQTSSVVLADLDRDGDLDLIQGNFYEYSREMLNDGQGRFTDTGHMLGTDVTAVAVGDLDGDYDLDLIEGTLGANRVWWNSLRTPPRNQIFADSGQLLGDTVTSAVALADMDGDGDLDMIEGNGINQSGKLWYYSPTGGFTDSGQVLGTNVLSLVTGDVDGDGDLDVVEGQSNNQPDRVWFNDGDGVLVDSGQALGAAITYDVVLADVEGDGDRDLLQGTGSSGVRIWLNDGQGTFSDTGQSYGSAGYNIAAGDLNADGYVDFINLDGSSTVWLNDQDGTFTSGQVINTGPTLSLVLGDIDDDNDLDLVIGREENSTMVWMNNGSGSFTDSAQVIGANFFIDAVSTGALALGDVDEDGDLDLIQDNSSTEANRVWINDGNGRFGIGQALGSASFALVMGDIDGDGDPDVVEGNSGATTVWLNDF